MCNESDQNEFNRTIRFDVPAVSESKPALRYRLFPPRFERKLGNAAPLYRKAFEMAEELKESDSQRFESMRLLPFPDEETRKHWWGDNIPNELPPEERDRFIEDYNELFEILDNASLYAECDWELSPQDLDWHLDKSISDHFLWSNENITWLLMIRTCYALEHNDFELAIRSTRSLFAMADNLLKLPMMTNTILTSGNISKGASCVRKLIASGKSPNLYWPLTQIPRFSKYHLQAVESDRNCLFSWHPQLKEVDNPNRDTDLSFWQSFATKFIESFQGDTQEILMEIATFAFEGEECEIENVPWEKIKEKARKRLLEQAAETYKNDPTSFEAYKESLYSPNLQTILDELPRIKQTILDGGYAPERVEQLCAEHLIAIYTVRIHEELLDEVTKWFGVDYLTWQAHPNGKAQEAAHQIIQSYGTKLADMAANTLGIFAYEMLTGCEQEIDALRIVEAIRLYAASHDGKLPKKLDKITEVPIPWDPTTGKSFKYKVEKTDEGRLGVLKFTSKGVWKYRYEIQITSL